VKLVLLLADLPSERFRFYNPCASVSFFGTLHKYLDSSHARYFDPRFKTVGICPKSHIHIPVHSVLGLGTVEFKKRKQTNFGRSRLPVGATMCMHISVHVKYVWHAHNCYCCPKKLLHFEFSIYLFSIICSKCIS
jgi:hypothetical protein